MFVEIFCLIISLFYFLNWKSIKRGEREKYLKHYFPGVITWKVLGEKYPQNLKAVVFLFLFTCTGFFKVFSFLCSLFLLFLDKIKIKPYEKLKQQNPKYSYYRKNFHFCFHIVENEEKNEHSIWSRISGITYEDGNALLQKGRDVKVLECSSISHG